MVIDLDPRLASGALSHLLENAAQYSPADRDIVVVGRAETDGLHVSVIDHGPGLDPGELDHLFERFYRGRTARQLSPGTGMGLAISRGLLAAAGGRVWAENVPGAGAKFSMVVPGSHPPRRGGSAEWLTASSSSTTSPTSWRPSRRCSARADMTCSRRCPDTLRSTAVHRDAPDLVILDLGLPDIDGVEVCTQIRESRSTPIVVLSARGGENDKVRALDAGADDYVTKPFGTRGVARARSRGAETDRHRHRRTSRSCAARWSSTGSASGCSPTAKRSG